MEIKIEDLNKGDSVLIGNSTGIRCVTLLRQPKIAKKPDWRGRVSYGKVLCSSKKIETKAPYTRTYKDSQGTIHSWSNPKNVDITYGMDENDHNHESYVDFNYKNIYLLKKSEI